MTDDRMPIAATEDRDVDYVDVTGWGVFKGHAIPVDVARFIAEKINLYHSNRATFSPVAWMHPTAGWTNKSRAAVLSHCRKDGPLPVPLYAAPPTSAPADVVEALRLTVEKCRTAIAGYDAALAKREHGGVAQSRAFDAIREAIDASPPVTALSAQGWRTPDGWKLVPVEPVPEMIGAWYRYKSGHHYPGEEPPRDTSDYGAYRAMIAAAPTAQGGA